MSRGVFFLVLIWLLAFFPLKAESAKTWWYTNPAFKVSLRFPGSWFLTSEKQQAGNIATFARGKKTAHSYLVIVADKLLTPLSLEEYARINLATTLGLLPNCRQISGKLTRLAGMEAKEVVLEWATEADNKITLLKPLQYYVIKGDTAYIFIFKIPKAAFEKDLPQIKEIMQTLKIAQ